MPSAPLGHCITKVYHLLPSFVAIFFFCITKVALLDQIQLFFQGYLSHIAILSEYICTSLQEEHSFLTGLKLFYNGCLFFQFSQNFLPKARLQTTIIKLITEQSELSSHSAGCSWMSKLHICVAYLQMIITEKQMLTGDSAQTGGFKSPEQRDVGTFHRLFAFLHCKEDETWTCVGKGRNIPHSHKFNEQ